jgi:ketosteroid isomerase-like protein
VTPVAPHVRRNWSLDAPWVVDTLRRMTKEDILMEFTKAWGRRDIEALMSYVTDDCVYGASVGPEPGQTFVGREAVREGFLLLLAHDAAATSGPPEVTVCGDRGVVRWSFIYGTGAKAVTVRGCDLFDFRGDRISRKDAYRKTT